MDQWPLLRPDERQLAPLPPGPPILLVTVDTEEEFDWTGPFLRTRTSVRNLCEQQSAQAIFDRFGVRPTYLVDYAVASQPEGYLPLREILQAGRCEIGAHLHPWVTPPFGEELGRRNSFSQNLPVALQRDKLARLTETIAENFGTRPICYRAGRLGVGEEIADILLSLGYAVELSVLPGVDLRRICGPDFRDAIDRPYWFGRGGALLEIPETSALTGLLAHRAVPRRFGIYLYNWLRRPVLDRFCLRGVLAGLSLLDETPLTPEGVEFAGLRRLTRVLLARGRRVFVMSYHSSSLLPGNTQFVRSAAELAAFLRTIEQYLEWFFGEVGGIAMTPSEVHAMLRPPNSIPVGGEALAPAAQ